MKQRGLVFIDMILDTRYGILHQISESLADLVASSDAYRTRYHDRFGSITNGQVSDEEFAERFAKRDVETLFHSKMTDFIHDLRRDTLEGIRDIDRGVGIELLHFDINTWPFKLDKKSAETIRRAVSHYIPQPATVGITYIEPAELTPTFLDNNYEMMAIYDHEDWLGPQTDAVIKRPIPNTVILTPQIASSGKIPDPIPGIGNPFLCRSAMLVKFVALHYIEVGAICYNPTIRQLIQSQRQQASALPSPSHQEQT